jgi:ribosomal protein L18E
MTRKPARRGRKPLPKAERKDRLIQTRVPSDLDETLREAAREQRVSVSQLIRNVLEDTFHLVDGVVAGAARLTERVKRDAERIAKSAQGKPRNDDLE